MTAKSTPLSSSDYLIVLLTVATAVIHFSRALADPEIMVLFTLNGLGYLALAAAYYLPIAALQDKRKWVRWLFIGYTAVTLLFYFIWGAMSGDWTIPLGPVDKVIEIVLLVLLWRARP